MAISNFALLDAARMHGDIHRARELNPDHTCLYEGDSERFLSAVAPWLFSLQPNGPFAHWIVEHGASQSWGVLFQSDSEPVKLYKHLRNFLIVQGEDGREMYFRYYDPRVLHVFLPSCEPDQLREFFGPISAFVAEDAQGLIFEYRLNDAGALDIVTTGIDLGQYLHVKEVPQTTQQPRAAIEQPKKSWDFGY